MRCPAHGPCGKRQRLPRKQPGRPDHHHPKRTEQRLRCEGCTPVRRAGKEVTRRNRDRRGRASRYGRSFAPLPSVACSCHRVARSSSPSVPAHARANPSRGVGRDANSRLVIRLAPPRPPSHRLWSRPQCARRSCSLSPAHDLSRHSQSPQRRRHGALRPACRPRPPAASFWSARCLPPSAVRWRLCLQQRCSTSRTPMASDASPR